jgi:hypothetical protein
VTSGPVPGWLVNMEYRSTLAGVVAAVLFAVTWPVFDQLPVIFATGRHDPIVGYMTSPEAVRRVILQATGT